jgi:hypothetical protein
MFREMKKFYNNIAVKILLILSLSMSIAVPVFFIHDYGETYDYSSGKEVTIPGLHGLRHMKKENEKVSGPLTEKKLNEALEFYKKEVQRYHDSNGNENKAIYEVEDKYPDFVSILNEAYAPYGQENSFPTYEIKNADDFYQRLSVKVKQKLNSSGNWRYEYSQAEVNESLERVSRIQTPFQNDFIFQWTKLITAFIFCNFGILLSAFFIGGQLFSFEREQNMAIILNSIGEKKLRLMGLKKIVAMILYLTGVFAVSTIVVCAIMIGVGGTSGWKTQLQITPELFESIYNWSYGKFVIYSILIAWFCLISIALITALINSIFQQTYISLIVSALLVLPPMFSEAAPAMPGFLKKILDIQPVNGLNSLSYVLSLHSYGIGSHRVLASTMIVILAFILCIVSAVLSPVLYAKRMNKG